MKFNRPSSTKAKAKVHFESPRKRPLRSVNKTKRSTTLNFSLKSPQFTKRTKKITDFIRLPTKRMDTIISKKNILKLNLRQSSTHLHSGDKRSPNSSKNRKIPRCPQSI